MPPKLLLFTGPPPPSTLTDSSCSIGSFTRPFHDLLNLDSPEPPPSPTQHTAWRSLPLTRQPLPTSQIQIPLDHEPSPHAAAAFFTTSHIDINTDPTYQDDDSLAQFCEQSLAAHASLASPSQEDSFDTSLSAASPVPIHPRQLHLSDLEDVPPARHVTALHPQTITLNLIVGVLSVAQPRTVTTRWGTSLSLVEVLVGDDTAAGFAVTFWVAPDKVPQSEAAQLRRQDVVLMENVALRVFRGKVYGQSLRGGLTRLYLLWRAGGGGCYSSRRMGDGHGDGDGDGDPQLEKARSVRDWVLRFVGRARGDGMGEGRGKGMGVVDWDKPPDDTQ